MLQVRLFGALQLTIDGQPRPLPRRRHAQLLLAYLAFNPGLHARATIASLLWPEVLDSSARGSLRSAIASLRRSLAPAPETYLVVGRDRLGLADGSVTVDVRQFHQAVSEGQLEQALEIASDEILRGLDHDWLSDARQQLRDEIASVLTRLASQMEAAGEIRAAIEYTKRALALDPLDETRSRQLMRRLVASGDRAAALGVYNNLLGRLRRELAILPSAATRDLAKEIRASTEPQPERQPPALPPALAADRATPFVGRATELQAMLGLLGGEARRGPQLILLTGEAGIGKTRLLAEFAAHAQRAGAELLYGQCLPESPLPVQPLVSALRHYAQSSDPEQLRAELPAIAGELGPLVPEFADPAIELPPPLAGDPQGESRRFVAAIVETLESIARRRRLILAIDDVHWTDQPSARLLEHLLASPRRFMVVLAAREPAPPVGARLVTRARRLQGGLRIHLAGLDEGDVAELLAGMRKKGSLPPATLCARSQGNPLLIEALVNHEQDDAVENELLKLPEAIADILGEEIASLEDDKISVLQTAAIIGEQFQLRVLRSSHGDEGAQTLDALDSAVAAGLVREDAVGHYSFRHALMREAILQRLTKTRRAHLHLEVANALIAHDGSARRQIAQHLLAAGQLAPKKLVANYAARAGADAIAMRAHDDAVRFYEEAIMATPATEGLRRAKLLVELGRAQLRAGQTSGTRDVFAQAAQLAEECENGGILGQAALGLCAVPYFPGEDPIDEYAVSLIARALVALPAAQRDLRARLMAQLAREQYFVDPPEAAADTARDALSLARESDNPAAVAEALSSAHAVAGRDGQIDRQRDLADELIELGTAHHDPQILVRGRTARAITQLELGQPHGLREEGAQLERLAAELRQPAYRWWSALWHATLALLLDSLDEGERRMREAAVFGRGAFGEAAELAYHSQSFWLHWQQGSLEQLPAEARELAERYRAIPAWRAIEALIAFERGETSDAEAILSGLVHRGLGPADDPALTATLLADVCFLSGNAAAASWLYEVLLPFRGRWAITRWGAVALSPIARPLGLMAAVLGRRHEARDELGDALEQARRVGAARLSARTADELERVAG